MSASDIHIVWNIDSRNLLIQQIILIQSIFDIISPTYFYANTYRILTILKEDADKSSGTQLVK